MSAVKRMFLLETKVQMGATTTREDRTIVCFSWVSGSTGFLLDQNLIEFDRQWGRMQVPASTPLNAKQLSGKLICKIPHGKQGSLPYKSDSNVK